MLMNDKIMFDHYYCINSTKHWENEEHISTIFHNLITFSYTSRLCTIWAGPSTHNLATICVMPGNEQNTRHFTCTADLRRLQMKWQ